MKRLFRMKNAFNAIILIAIQSYFMTTNAQNNVLLSAEMNVLDELAKIKLQKLEIDANLKKQETACYKKFAVSDCLNDAKTESKMALNTVKLRENDIKELQRKIKTESDLNKSPSNKNAAKNSDEVAYNEASIKTAKVAKSVNPTRAIQSDAEILAKKSVNDKLRADAAKKRLEESNQKLAASQKKAQSRANKNSQSAAKTAAYNQKIIQAEAHKAELDKKNLERKKAKSAPLPIPDSIPAIKVR